MRGIVDVQPIMNRSLLLTDRKTGQKVRTEVPTTVKHCFFFTVSPSPVLLIYNCRSDGFGEYPQYGIWSICHFDIS